MPVLKKTYKCSLLSMLKGNKITFPETSCRIVILIQSESFLWKKRKSFPIWIETVPLILGSFLTKGYKDTVLLHVVCMQHPVGYSGFSYFKNLSFGSNIQLIKFTLSL